jgi:hypothetical protein
MWLFMKVDIIPISKIGDLSKYLMIHTGSRKWRRTFFACIDHDLLTPIVKRWQGLPNKKYNPIWPKLVEVIVDDDTLIEMNYSYDSDFYHRGIGHALKLAERKLQHIGTDEDLFTAILDKEFNTVYPNIVHDHMKILCTGIITSAQEKLSFEAAFEKSEAFFEKKLNKKDLLLAYFHCKKITSASEFAQQLHRK